MTPFTLRARCLNMPGNFVPVLRLHEREFLLGKLAVLGPHLNRPNARHVSPSHVEVEYIGRAANRCRLWELVLQGYLAGVGILPAAFRVVGDDACRHLRAFRFADNDVSKAELSSLHCRDRRGVLDVLRLALHIAIAGQHLWILDFLLELDPVKPLLDDFDAVNASRGR